MEEASTPDEEDPVVNEVNVYLSQSLSKHLYLLQYPLRPAHLPYDSDDVVEVRVRPQQQQVEIDLAVRPRGENYSTSRGEYFAKMVELSKSTNVVTEPYYRSGLMDKHTLTSDSLPLKTSRYAAAVFKDGELHMTPLHGLVQLRPSLSHLDKTDTGSKKVGIGGVEGGALSEGDTTGSEGEEAKPVQVRFARPDSVRASQSVRKPSYQSQEHQREEETWVPLLYHGMDSECTTEERQLLFASEEDHRNMFGVTQSEYLDLVCPMECPEERGVPATPSGVVSLSQLRMLPVPQQVKELLTRSHVMQFEKLCSLLGGRSQALVLLEAVQECGVLVQGCWVVASEVVYPGERNSMLRSARDYILWCFTQSRILVKKDIALVTKVCHEDVRKILHTVSVQRPAQGWEFKLPNDQEFCNKYSLVVLQQCGKWDKRYKELVSELGISKEQVKQPSSSASHAKLHSHSSKSPHSSKGEQQGKSAPKKTKAEGVAEGKEKSSENSSKLSPIKLSPTAHPHHIHHQPPLSTVHPPPLPMDTGEVTVSSEEECLSPVGLASPTPLSPRLSALITQATSKPFSFCPVKEEEPSQELLDALMQFCREALGRGVMALTEIKNKLLLKQASLVGEHPLRSHGVPDSLLESALQAVGAMEVGQACGRRLFALEHTGEMSDKHRSIVLRLFQKHRYLRRRQLLEEMGEDQPDSKTLSSILREICYSKASQWYLHGT